MQDLLNKLVSIKNRVTLDDYDELIQLASKYGIQEQVSECFDYEEGWIFCGLDFASLEDRISALTTKDPQKLKVYMGVIVYSVTIDGVDHHIRDDDTIVYDGKTFTGEEFYNAYTNSLL